MYYKMGGSKPRNGCFSQANLKRHSARAGRPWDANTARSRYARPERRAYPFDGLTGINACIFPAKAGAAGRVVGAGCEAAMAVRGLDHPPDAYEKTNNCRN